MFTIDSVKEQCWTEPHAGHGQVAIEDVQQTTLSMVITDFHKPEVETKSEKSNSHEEDSQDEEENWPSLIKYRLRI